MKNRFPRRQELVVLIAISLLCTVIVGVSGKYDVGLAVLGVPVFLVAALMGFRRVSMPAPAIEAATVTAPVDSTATPE
jgi:hypothetical protein